MINQKNVRSIEYHFKYTLSKNQKKEITRAYPSVPQLDINESTHVLKLCKQFYLSNRDKKEQLLQKLNSYKHQFFTKFPKAYHCIIDYEKEINEFLSKRIN